jgi:hypothetical protein
MATLGARRFNLVRLELPVETDDGKIILEKAKPRHDGRGQAARNTDPAQTARSIGPATTANQ